MLTVGFYLFLMLMSVVILIVVPPYDQTVRAKTQKRFHRFHQKSSGQSCFVTLHKFVGEKIEPVEKNCRNFVTDAVADAEPTATSTAATAVDNEAPPGFEPGSPQPFPRHLLRQLTLEN